MNSERSISIVVYLVAKLIPFYQVFAMKKLRVKISSLLFVLQYLVPFHKSFAMVIQEAERVKMSLLLI